MYLSKLRLWNFRKYSEGHDGSPGLEVLAKARLHTAYSSLYTVF